MVDDESAYRLYQRETRCIRILCYTEYPDLGVIVFLVDLADQNVTAPAYRDLKKGTLRHGRLRGGEGVAVSAHVALALDSFDDNAPRYRILLEHVPGLGRSTLEPFLKAMLKQAAGDRFTWRDDTADERERKFYPAATLEGTPSEELVEDMQSKSGAIVGIELVKHFKDQKAFDEAGILMEDTVTLRLRPEKPTPEGIAEFLGRMRFLAMKQGYQNMTVRYKNQWGKQRTAQMGTTKADIADVLVLRTEQLVAEDDLEQARNEIYKPFSDRMASLVASQK